MHYKDKFELQDKKRMIVSNTDVPSITTEELEKIILKLPFNKATA